VEAAATLNAAIEQVFFYQNAVLIAAVGIRARTPSENLAARWLELSDRLHVPLRVCQSAAMRRGVISDSEADVRHLPRGNWQRGFEEASLADLSEACARPNTKLIQFRG
jgi:tRNA 2-thiouridine synthesizing protein D